MTWKVHCRYDEMLNPSLLKDHKDNTNKHPSDQITRLSLILEYQGWRSPIVVSKQTNMITQGHARKMAALESGIEFVPVVFQDYVDYDQEKAALTSDNAIALQSELDWAKINADLPNFDPSFNLDLLGIKGFTLDISEKKTNESFHKEKECPACGHKW